MNLEVIISKTRNGEVLSSKELSFLLKKVGAKVETGRMLFKIILIIIGISLILSKDFYLMVLGTLIISCVIYSMIVNDHIQNSILYINAAYDFISNKFHKYRKFNHIYIAYKSTNKLNDFLIKDFVHFLTDGYNFVVYDDMLCDADGNLPRFFKKDNGERQTLKVYDKRTIDKNSIHFTLDNIESFRLRGDMVSKTRISTKTKSSIITQLMALLLGKFLLVFFTKDFLSSKVAAKKYIQSNINSEIIDKRFTLLVLKDETVLRFGPELYELLIEVIPTKEK